MIISSIRRHRDIHCRCKTLTRKMEKNKNESLIKILDFSVLFVFILLLVTSILELPPSSYLISFYCELFDTESYYPMLITALTTLIYALLIRFIKTKLIKQK